MKSITSLLLILILTVSLTYQTEVTNNLDNLCHKLKSGAKTPSELSKIQELTQIIKDIKEFEIDLIERQNQTLEKDLSYGMSDIRVADFVTRVVTNIAVVVDVNTFFESVREGLATSLTCLGCNSLLAIIFTRVIAAESLAFAFIRVCSALDLTTNEVCDGFINGFKDQVEYIREHSRMDTFEMCGLLMGDHCYIGESPNIHWKVEIPPKKLNQTIDAKEDSKLWNKVYKILQLTDIHLDLDYVPITENSCRTPYCCRVNARGASSNTSLNYWGSYPCDTPMQTLDNLFREVNWISIDWVYWTGDVTPHDSWQESRLKSVQTSQVITNYLKIFAKNKVIVPVLGNHVTVPINSFPPSGLEDPFSISWLYDDMAQQWSQWLPTEALESLRHGGYYTLKIRSGFRIIVLNTNYCARLNIWILYRSVDLSDHLKWLIQELLAAEEAGDLVHIVGHIPPDNRECTQSWLYNYMAIVERFSDTIVGQFFGHTHYDEFRVLYSVNNSSKPIGLEIISPSLTTYSESNPAYRVISCKQNGRLTDLDTYTFDLRAANEKPDSLPDWYHEYSMAKTYPLKDFDGNQFDRLIHDFESNDNILQTFYRLTHRNSSHAKKDCDERCKSKIMNNVIVQNPFHQKPKPIYEKLKIIKPFIGKRFDSKTSE